MASTTPKPLIASGFVTFLARTFGQPRLTSFNIMVGGILFALTGFFVTVILLVIMVATNFNLLNVIE